MKLLIMRHGETFWNTEGRLQGQTDIPLNKNGILMAQSCGKGMKDVKVDLCVSSTLLRAAQTAELCMAYNEGYSERSSGICRSFTPSVHQSIVKAPCEKIRRACLSEYPGYEENTCEPFYYITDDRLKEAGFGPWEGKICRGEGYNVPLENFGVYWSEPDSPLITEGVERLTAVSRRVEESLKSYIDDPLLKDKTVLFVVHGCVMRSILYLMNGKKKFSGRVSLNCEVMFAHPGEDVLLIEDGRKIFYDESMAHDYYATMVQE